MIADRFFYQIANTVIFCIKSTEIVNKCTKEIFHISSSGCVAIYPSMIKNDPLENVVVKSSCFSIDSATMGIVLIVPPFSPPYTCK